MLSESIPRVTDGQGALDGRAEDGTPGLRGRGPPGPLLSATNPGPDDAAEVVELVESFGAAAGEDEDDGKSVFPPPSC